MNIDDHQEISVQEETAIDQRIIPFEGDDLAAAIVQNGTIYISIPGLCRALGMNVQAQTRRISRTRSLAKGLRQIFIQTSQKGSTRLTYCLRLDRVALWLAGIETDRLKPQFQAKIEAYQDDLAEVATVIFFQHMGIAPQANTQTVIEYEALRDILRLMVDHLSALAQMPAQLDQVISMLGALTKQQTITASAVSGLTSHLTPAQKSEVANAVNIIVKDSANKPGQLNHAQVYGALRKHFNVAKYDEIPIAQFEQVIAFLRDLWQRATAGKVPEQKNLF